MSKKEDLKSLSMSELKSKITLYKKSQLNLRFQRAIGESVNTNIFKTNRRNIARIMTEVNNRDN